MREVLPIDVPDGAELLGVRALLVAAHDGDGAAAGVRDELHGERAEPAARPPDEHDVAGLHGVRGPSEEHAVGGGAGERRRGGLLPGEEVGLRQALVRLHLAELRERAPARVVAPHAEAAREPGVLAGHDPRIVEIPLTRVHDDPVADLHVRHLVAHGVDDARRVGAHDVEVRRLAPPGLRLRDVDGHASGRPHVVEVHPAGHDHHEGVVRPELGHVDHLALDRRLGLAVSIGTHELRMHLRRHLPDRRDLAELVQVLGHVPHPPPTSASSGNAWHPSKRSARRGLAQRGSSATGHTAARGHHEQ